LIDGPDGDLQVQRKRSFCLRCSKNIKLLHERSKHRSSMTYCTSLRSILFSFLMLGIREVISSTKWRNLPAMPLEMRISVRCLFFHSLESGSASLKARSSCSESTSSASYSSSSSWGFSDPSDSLTSATSSSYSEETSLDRSKSSASTNLVAFLNAVAIVLF
jgi:hypothetical protein